MSIEKIYQLDALSDFRGKKYQASIMTVFQMMPIQN
ncbi:hypothetical protein C7332_0278 [Serratia ficaria]|nr:hypothetical protein C7332_0278 [Serratia ficaria]